MRTGQSQGCKRISRQRRANALISTNFQTEISRSGSDVTHGSAGTRSLTRQPPKPPKSPVSLVFKRKKTVNRNLIV